jgi:hypothetical protein
LATIYAPIYANICDLITIVIIRVSFLAIITPEGIVIGTHFTINAIAINIPRAITIIEVLATLTIDTAILAEYLSASSASHIVRDMLA